MGLLFDSSVVNLLYLFQGPLEQICLVLHSKKIKIDQKVPLVILYLVNSWPNYGAEITYRKLITLTAMFSMTELYKHYVYYSVQSILPINKDVSTHYTGACITCPSEAKRQNSKI